MTESCKYSFKNTHWPTALAGTLLTAALGLFAFLSLNNFISHSEFWSISSGRLLGSFDYEALIIYARPFFYLILKIPYFFELSNQEHIKVARLIFGLLATIHLFLSWVLARKLSKSHLAAFFYIVFLLSFQVYFYNIYRVRSDLVCQVFTLLALNRIWDLFQKPELPKKFDGPLAIYTLLITMATPKALYSLIWLCVFYIFLFKKKERSPEVFRNMIFVFCGIATFAAFAVSVLTALYSDGANTYVTSLHYYAQSFSKYWNLLSLQALIRSIKINILHYLIILTGVFFYFNKPPKKNIEDRSLFLLFYLALATLIIHPERWDYFIASIIAYLSLPALFVFQKLECIKGALPLLTLPLVWLPLHMTYYSHWFVSNEQQMNAISQLEIVMRANPKANYFDGTGILPRENAVMKFLGPNDKIGANYTLEHIKKHHPDFIFQTTKFDHAGPQGLILLHQYYQEVEFNIWVNKEEGRNLDTSLIQKPEVPLSRLFIYDHHPKLRW